MFIRDLAAGETICIQPSALVYKDPSVGMQLHIEYPNAGGPELVSGRYSYRQVWLRMWGPGRVAVQSVFERPEASEPDHQPFAGHHRRRGSAAGVVMTATGPPASFF